MFEQENKIKPVIAAIAGPFATASALLLFVLALAEYFRHGFVALFLDLRIIAGVVLGLWAIAVWAEEPPRWKWPGRISLVAVLAACALTLWCFTAPFGRLGLVVFVCGLAAFGLAFAASAKSSSH